MNGTTAKESRLTYTAHGIKGRNGEEIGGIGRKVNYLPAWYDFDPVRLEICLTVKGYEPLEISPPAATAATITTTSRTTTTKPPGPNPPTTRPHTTPPPPHPPAAIRVNPN